MMKLRTAKIQDANELGYVHWICSANQAGGFMYELGRPFFQEYYRILLNEKNSLVVCAEDEHNKIIGLVTGSLKSEEHIKALQNHKYRFLIPSILNILRNPRLIRRIISRMRSGSALRGKGYIVTEGPRLEYWGWLPDYKSNLGAVEMLKTWLAFLRLLGARTVRHEVDCENKKSEELHFLLGSKVIMEFVTPEGKQRKLMEYKLDK